MIRVLHVVDHMGLGGIQSFIMNVYRNIDRSKIQFDFLLHKKDGNRFLPEIQCLGGVVYFVPARNKGVFHNKVALNSFFKTHPEYKVVHQHESSLSYIEPLIAARHNGVPIRIIHSHSSRMSNSIMHRILHIVNAWRVHRVATHFLACGCMAGRWFYSQSKIKDGFTVVLNAISLRDFQFDEQIRKEVRCELGLCNEKVYCHIGRFDSVKNHSFLIDVFYELVKLESGAKLVLVGTGPLMEEVRRKSDSLGLHENIMFLGLRKDVNRILQAVDAVILPSIYEGFPLTAIEAQAAGLPFVMSDSVSSEALIKSNTLALSLDQTPKYWASCIVKNVKRIPDNAEMYKNGFDIANTVMVLTNIYSAANAEKKEV